MQVNINIGELNVPVVQEEGYTYYPAAYIGKHILLRGKKALLSPNIKEKYKDRIIKRELIFNEDNIQESNLIREDVLKEILVKTRIGHLDEGKRTSQNIIHKHLGIKLLPTGASESKYQPEWNNTYDHYVKEIVELVTKETPDIDFRLCSKCNVYLPLNNLFFNPDERASRGFTKVCLKCGKGIDYVHPEGAVKKLNRHHPELFRYYVEGNAYEIINALNNGIIKRLPSKFDNKDSYIKFFNVALEKGEIDKEKLSLVYLKDKLKNNIFSKHLTITEIYNSLFGEDFYLTLWEYPSFILKDIRLTNERANDIFKRYLKAHGITIDNLFDFKYEEHFIKSRIRSVTDKGTLEFIVYFNDMKHPGYKYKHKAGNYYKKEDNLLFDLKYLIEEDLKIPIEKVPLYLTRQVLATRARPLYHSIITNKNGNLFYWVDKLYPGKFIQLDFDLNPHRIEFDSDEELFFDELLRTEFDNVLYNPRNADKTIHINGMIPDWFIFTDKGVIIVELYGLYVERQYNKSSRVTDYIDKTNSKIKKYENEIEGYQYLLIYKDDLDNDNFGSREKIRKLKEKLGIPTV